MTPNTRRQARTNARARFNPTPQGTARTAPHPRARTEAPAATPRRVALLALALAALPTLARPRPAPAAPEQPSVVHGQADFAQTGATTTINVSNNAVINYRSFNIDAHETVRFVQPSASARVLNRVLDGNQTRIDGRLLSNGHLYIANPAGIFFGDHAVVRVGAITAAAGNIANADFLNRTDRFTDLDGSILNDGAIHASAVRLLGSRVANRGQIVAPDGLVAMAAGQSVYLADPDDQSGLLVEIEGPNPDARPDHDAPTAHAVENTGVVDARGGVVSFAASDVYTLAARQAGSIDADRVDVDALAGDVALEGATRAASDVTVHAANIEQTGLVKAGADAGGSITLDAHQTYLAHTTAVLDASGSNGPGGQIVVWSDLQTAFDGAALALDAGFVELSSAGRLQLGPNARVDTDGGRLFLDPKNIIVTADPPNGAADPLDRFIDNPADDSYLTPDQIVNALLNGDLILQANNDLTIDDPVDAAEGVGWLGLYAGRSVLINADLALPAGLDVSANTPRFDGVVDSHRDPGPARIVMAPNASISAADHVDIDLDAGWGLTNFDAGDIDLQQVSLANGDLHVRHQGRAVEQPVTVYLRGPIEAGEVRVDAGLNLPGRFTAADLQIDADVDAALAFDARATASVRLGGFASIAAAAGSVNIDAGGDIDMAMGSSIHAGDNPITLFAIGDIRIAELASDLPHDDGVAILVTSADGDILDSGDFFEEFALRAESEGYYGEGDGDADLLAANGEVVLIAPSGHIGEGDETVDPLEIEAGRLTAWTNGGNQYLTVLSDLDAFDLDAVDGYIELMTPAFDFLLLDDDDGLYDLIAGSAYIDVFGDLGSPSPLAHVDQGNANAVDFKIDSFDPESDLFVAGSDYSVLNADPIDVTVDAAPADDDAFVVSTTGSVAVNAAALLDQGAGQTPIDIAADGTVTVNAPLTTDAPHSGITIHTKGALDVNAPLQAAGSASDVRIASFGSATFAPDAPVDAPNGDIDVVVGPAARNPNAQLLMQDDGANTTTFSVGPGAIEIDALGDIQLGRLLSAAGLEDAVAVESRRGAIANAGNAAGPNLDAPAAGAQLHAADGIGDDDPLLVNVDRIEAINHANGDVQLTSASDLGLDHVENHGGGDVVVIADGSINLFDDTVLVDDAVVRLTAGDDLLLDGAIAFAAQAFLTAGADGTGLLQWTGAHEAVAADEVHLAAGDGPDGDNAASIDYTTNDPTFTDADADGTPAVFTLTHDGDLAADIAEIANVYGFLGDLADASFSFTSLAGAVDLTDSICLSTGLDIALDAAGDIALDGIVTMDTLDLQAGNAVVMAPGSGYFVNGPVNLQAGAGVQVAEIRSESNAPDAIVIDAGTDISSADPDNLFPNLAAPSGGAVLTAAGDVGNPDEPLTTAVARLAFNSDGGDVAIANDNEGAALTLDAGPLETTLGTTGGGATSISNASPMLINSDLLLQGPAALEARGDPQNPADNLTVAPGVAITLDASQPATLQLVAGDNVVLQAESLVQTTGSPDHLVGVIADIDPDPDNDGNPGVFILGGSVVAPNISVRAPELQPDGGTLDAGDAGNITLTGFDLGEAIALGAAFDPEQPALEIPQALLDALTADTLLLGDAASGTVDLAAFVDASAFNRLRIESGQAVSNTSGGTLLANDLLAVAVDDIELAFIADNVAAASTNGEVDLTSEGAMHVATVLGVPGIDAGGAIHLTANLAFAIEGNAASSTSQYTDLPGGGQIPEISDLPLPAAQNGTYDITQAPGAPLLADAGPSTFSVPAGSSILLDEPTNDLAGDASFHADGGPLNNLAIANLSPLSIGNQTIAGDLNATMPTLLLTGDYGSTGGVMTFNADVELRADAVVSGREVVFNNRINSDSTQTKRRLDVNTFDNGVTTFNGTIGAGPNDLNDLGLGDDRPLEHLGANADGVTVFNTDVIVVDGPASAEFDNAARINRDLEITELGGGPVTFGGPVDANPGAQPGAEPSLTVNTAGTTTFAAPIGEAQPLGSVTTDPPGNTIISSNVKTSGPQTYNDVVEATEPVQLSGAQINLEGGTAPNSAPIDTSIVALASSPNLAELLPGEGDAGAGAETPTGPPSELAAALAEAGIDLPPALRDAAAERRIQNAVDDYLLTLDLDDAFTPAGFVRFLTGRADQRAAAATFYAARDALERINDADLDDARKRQLRRRAIDAVRPTGVSRDEFEAILQALPRDGAVALRG